MLVDSVDHTFELGVYTVCIQISSDSCVTSYCEVIDLSDPCLTITPDFKATKDGTSLTVDFADLTSGSPDSWLWGFGDGTTSTDQNPVHTFAAFGEYNVCLFVQEEDNLCSKTICRKISVGTTSILEIENFKALNIFPNPSLSENIIRIEGFDNRDIGRPAVVQIMDSNGRLLQSYREILKSTANAYLENYIGVYFISIKTENNLYRSMGIRH